MKKYMVWLISALMAVSMTACSNAQKKDTKDQAQITTAAKENETQTEAAKTTSKKEKKKFLVQNSISNLAGFLSMIVLGAYSASIGPVILTIQGIITYIYEEKKKKKQPKWLLIMYPLLSLIAGSLTITSILSILPIISSTLASTMLITKNMKTSRKINLVSSVLALPYLITNKAYVAAIIFSASFINTLEAIYKIDYKKANNNTKTTNTENQEKEIANNKAMVPSQNITHNKNISKPKTKKLILKKKE